MTLTDKMKAWEPAAVWSEAGEGMFLSLIHIWN